MSDDGVGTTMTTPELRKDGGFGLYRMRERTLELNGEFKMKGAINEGLIVTLVFPSEEKRPRLVEEPEELCRVILADDHNIFREGLRSMLELQDRLEVVGEVSDGRGGC